jgi:NCAIR mutase (PurE)-related protein
MDPNKVQQLLEQVAQGDTSVETALSELRALPYREMAEATIDQHRALRQGCPEVIYAESKTDEQVLAIAEAVAESGHNVLTTRTQPSAAALLCSRFDDARYVPMARTVRIEPQPAAIRKTAPVAIVCAGTSDIPVAEEAIETLCAVGLPYERVYDVGVAGLHRLLAKTDTLQSASTIIVIAGMEGALPSVVGGIVACPVVAVPTSVGYGAAMGGFAALLGMLSSCASGVVVVNIDNGFGAAMAAHRMLPSHENKETEE